MDSLLALAAASFCLRDSKISSWRPASMSEGVMYPTAECRYFSRNIRLIKGGRNCEVPKGFRHCQNLGANCLRLSKS